MPQQRIQIVALFKSKPDKIEALKVFLNKLIEPTRKEAGCHFYELHQNTSDPTDFAFIEEWESHESIDRHMQTPHIQAALPHVGEYLQLPPDIRRYKKI